MFLLYSRVIQLFIHTHTHTHVFIFFSIMIYHKKLKIVPCAVQLDLAVYPPYIY